MLDATDLKYQRRFPQCQVLPDGVVTCYLSSDGTPGFGWIHWMKSLGHVVTDSAQQVLRSPKFIPSLGELFKIAILPGSLWRDGERTVANICAEARRRGLYIPGPEVTCLLREKFTDVEIESMGFHWITVMHEYIPDDTSMSRLLSICVDPTLGLCTSTGDGFAREAGFAFLTPKYLRMQDGTVTVEVTTNGKTLDEWWQKFEQDGRPVRASFYKVQFDPSVNQTYQVTIVPQNLPGEVKAKMEKKLRAPSLEVAFLLHEMLSPTDMSVLGLSEILVRHQPVRFSGPRLQLCLAGSWADWRACHAYEENESSQVGFVYTDRWPV